MSNREMKKIERFGDTPMYGEISRIEAMIKKDEKNELNTVISPQKEGLPIVIKEDKKESLGTIDEKEIESSAVIDENLIESPEVIVENVIESAIVVVENEIESAVLIDENKIESAVVIDENDEKNSKSTRNEFIKNTGKVLVAAAFIGGCAWGLPKLYKNFSTETTVEKIPFLAKFSF